MSLLFPVCLGMQCNRKSDFSTGLTELISVLSSKLKASGWRRWTWTERLILADHLAALRHHICSFWEGYEQVFVHEQLFFKSLAIRKSASDSGCAVMEREEPSVFLSVLIACVFMSFGNSIGNLPGTMWMLLPSFSEWMICSFYTVSFLCKGTLLSDQTTALPCCTNSLPPGMPFCRCSKETSPISFVFPYRKCPWESGKGTCLP